MLQQPIFPAPRGTLADRVDVDFSLAIHNRTGKYFIGRDLLETADLPIGDTYYWWIRPGQTPEGYLGRIIARLQLHHIRAHVLGGPMRLLPRRNPRRPLLHLDPFTVPSTTLRLTDAVLVHDLGHLTHPELFEPAVSEIYRPIFDEIARVGPHLIFVSQNSLREFQNLYPASTPASMRYIYNATRSGPLRASPEPLAEVSQPFLLTVGSIGTRKNQLRCIKAFARSGLAQSGVSYVMCGPADPGFDEVQAAARNTPGVVLLPYVEDVQLAWLYRSAAGFVLMSLLEGFGMPVAEAIACGLVPLVTRDSVLEEVAGDAALVADAQDVNEIARAMRSLANMSPAERGRRTKRLTAAIERFDIATIRDQWRVAFRDILATAGRR